MTNVNGALHSNLNTPLNDLAVKLRIHGRHPSCLILVHYLLLYDVPWTQRLIDFTIEITKYDAALLTRCYTQHALRPFIDSESNNVRSFIKILFINKGIDFIDLPSIFQDKSVIVYTYVLPTFRTSYYLLQIYIKKKQSEILVLISINLFLILISMLILLSIEIVKIQNMFINQPDICTEKKL